MSITSAWCFECLFTTLTIYLSEKIFLSNFELILRYALFIVTFKIYFNAFFLTACILKSNRLLKSSFTIIIIYYNLFLIWKILNTAYVRKKTIFITNSNRSYINFFSGDCCKKLTNISYPTFLIYFVYYYVQHTIIMYVACKVIK